MKCKSALFICLLISGIKGYNSNAQTNGNISPDFHHLVYQDSSVDLKENDSVSRWKKDRQFAYMYYLDSLLRKEKNLRSDTMTLDESTGTIIRRDRLESKPTILKKIITSLPFQIFFWLLALVCIVIIFYKVLFQNSILKLKKPKLNTHENEEPIEELYDNLKYVFLIEAAEKNNQFNLATRYLFLQTLKNLSNKNLIVFAPQKTNKEYVKEMSKNKFNEQFQKLTSEYEYAWYGKFTINRQTYFELKEQFYSFNKNV